MKIRDKKDLQTKSTAELEKLLKENYGELLTIKLEKEQNILKNTRSLFLKRKDIAVIRSILNYKKEEGGDK